MSTTTSDIAAGDDRTTAQFFFEVGYSAAWADAYMANGKKAAFPISDESLERAWAIAPEAHDDREEWDRHMAATQSAWQPIDTAPKDGWGAPILTCRMGEPTDWFGKESVGGYAEPPEAAYWNEHGDCWTPCQRPHDGWEPTHWTPLPTTPSQIEEG